VKYVEYEELVPISTTLASLLVSQLSKCYQQMSFFPLNVHLLEIINEQFNLIRRRFFQILTCIIDQAKKDPKIYLPIFKCILKVDYTKEAVDGCLKESKKKMSMDEVNKCVEVINLFLYVFCTLMLYY
jgi:hypothetical protein